MRLNDIHLRDPYVLPVREHGTYYLYGTTGRTAWDGRPEGFDVYTSKDLTEWEGPYPAFRPDASFWADREYWAPEVHVYRGKYYMFATFKAEGRCRAVQILRADHPLGPFAPNGEGPVTPADWECLDGTLYVDESGLPWMVFCHEWLQVKNGKMCAVRLTEELDAAIGDPVVLFRAADASWVVPVEGDDRFVTDGPFLVREEDGRLLMLWSSCGKDGYAIGIAHSDSGQLAGSWRQEPTALFGKDGGHGMLFADFSDRLLLSIHVPNVHPQERPAFFPVRQDGDSLLMVDR
ncbi:glycoside hydrolase family 43 protein [Cohnella abietis]|uniref:Glycosyl hydrolase family 43 n=1 Tax=Cohnella abietis TaxID=2507935 RepID=A0A3T1D0E6_9BACL|nr:glycoside hydrolase family 43 protein [Cohnella abietis]BBI31573.1 glycosyl hydrolase family 43 [Cohnella abietis]